MAETFSLALTTELNEHKSALPANFNVERFVQNSVALLNNNDSLMKFAQQYGTAQIKAGLMRAAYQGLDALNGEIYLIPYSGSLQFMPSFKGMQKMAKRYSKRPIRDIYSRIVREGDEFEVGVKDGEPTINFTEKPFNTGEILGVFAVALFEDGGLTYEVMSKSDVEACREEQSGMVAVLDGNGAKNRHPQTLQVNHSRHGCRVERGL